MIQEITIEIRDAEGGEDSKLLVHDMADIYLRFAQINGHKSSVKESRDGFVCIWLTGNNVKNIFEQEEGNHRFQRVPPTEKRGRVQTSSITVSVIDRKDLAFVKIKVDPNDVEKDYIRGTGNGGQKKNKTSSCVVLRHTPTGIIVRCEDQRNRTQNEIVAWDRLQQRLQDIYNTSKVSSLKDSRIKTTHRGEKRRTYRVQDGIVVDHVTGKRVDIKQIYKGNIDLLHC